MGIRFFCPNGHKLNVKEFQAGRTGICPYCGAKTRIPITSTRKSSRESKGQSSDGSDEVPRRSPASAVDMTYASGAVALPVATPLEQIPGGGSSAPGVVSPTVGPPPLDIAHAVSDPIAEAGDAVWYVQPPSGGQYGPAGPNVMRTWLAEGRVAPNAYVWREGWQDWQLAAEVFPQLAHEQPPPPASPLDESSLSSGGLTMRLAPRRYAESTQVIVIIALVIAVLVLLVLLVWVVWHESGATNPAAQWPTSWSGDAVAGSTLYSPVGDAKT